MTAKLTVEIQRDARGKPALVVLDDRGDPLPCVRTVDLHYRYNEPTELVVRFVVDCKRVVLGTTTAVPAIGST